MKRLILGLLMLGAVAFAASIDGKWVDESQVGAADGKTYTLTTTYTLKNDRGTLTGTIVQASEAGWMREMNGKAIDISDGKVDGDRFSFKVKLDTKQGEKTAVYEGTIESDRLKGVIKFRGIGMTRPIDAKRTN
jgi:uncharacterized Fe-S center protein